MKIRAMLLASATIACSSTVWAQTVQEVEVTDGTNSTCYREAGATTVDCGFYTEPTVNTFVSDDPGNTSSIVTQADGTEIETVSITGERTLFNQSATQQMLEVSQSPTVFSGINMLVDGVAMFSTDPTIGFAEFGTQNGTSSLTGLDGGQVFANAGATDPNLTSSLALESTLGLLRTRDLNTNRVSFFRTSSTSTVLGIVEVGTGTQIATITTTQAGHDIVGNTSVAGTFAVSGVSTLNGINNQNAGITNAGLVSGVTAGAVNATSTEAVNGSQLFDTNQTVAAVQTTANTALTTATTAQTTANTALTNAATAQTTANSALANAATAQSTADTALTNAATAQSTADTALANAATAQSTADTALANAATAQSTADTALANAATAQTTAEGAATAAAAAQTAADAAQGTADTALANAATAQTTAEGAATAAAAAQTAAGGAQTTANTALANAATAQTTAEGAATAAASAQTAANAAQGTADTALANAATAQTTATGAATAAAAAQTASATAVTNSEAAVVVANEAMTTANGIATTANTALTNSQNALTAATAAQTLASGFDNRITLLESGFADLRADLNKVDATASRGVAIASAFASIPDIDDDKKFGVGVGVGHYNDKTAFSIAVGARASDNAEFRVNVGSTGSGKVAIGGGGMFSW